MGAWGHGSFENDDAADWVGDFERDGIPAVRSALEQVSTLAQDEYLDATAASMAIAATELVAASRDGDLSKLPESIREAFATHRPSLNTAEILEVSRQSIARILHQSELKELWEESDDNEIWMQEMVRLAARLG